MLSGLISVNGQVAADIYWKIVGKIKTDQPQGCPTRDQNGFRPKSLKARNDELSGVCPRLLNEPQMKHPLSRVVWGSSPRNFWLLGSQMVHSSAIFGHCTPIPLPPRLQFFFSLQIYTDLKNGPGS